MRVPMCVPITHPPSKFVFSNPRLLNATLIRSVRKLLRERLPTANELVYDNYNFFVIGYCSTDRRIA